MLSSSSIVHAYWVSLEDKGLFSSANILQITKKTVYLFFEYSLMQTSHRPSRSGGILEVLSQSLEVFQKTHAQSLIRAKKVLCKIDNSAIRRFLRFDRLDMYNHIFLHWTWHGELQEPST